MQGRESYGSFGSDDKGKKKNKKGIIKEREKKLKQRR